MLSLAEAQAAILSRIVRARESEALPLDQAHGRYLAAPARARVDNPAFDNSAMDGFAVNTADLRSRHTLPVRGEAGCGDAPGVLAPESAMRIFTGAPIPKGADAVVMQEDVEREDALVRFPDDVAAGRHIRRRGEDFRAEDVLFQPGRRLAASDLALLAAAGVAAPRVFRRPRVLVIATGDELVAPGAALRPGQIYESNRLATLIQCRELGAETVDGGIVRDNVAALREVLDAADDFDFVITSGGASVGDRDLVRQIFAERGEIAFWKARIKPGKPIAFGLAGPRTHFFALPGNPVSSLVTFKLFVEPALVAWHHGAPAWLELTARAANGFRRTPGRMEFLRARLQAANGEMEALALSGQGSHMIGTLRDTNALIRIDEDSAGFEQGEPVRVLPLRLDLA